MPKDFWSISEAISKNKRLRQEAADIMLQKAVGNAVDKRGNCSIMWNTLSFWIFANASCKKMFIYIAILLTAYSSSDSLKN
jgi:hypothetical protein